METRRTTAAVAQYKSGNITRGRCLANLHQLNDWALYEVASAATEDYRDSWAAERDASADCIVAIEGGAI